MGATKLMTAAGGGITLDAASTASDKTITVPARTGNMAVDGPAFSAYSNNNQTLSETTWTKVQCGVETFDTASAYDSTTNYRFQPQVAGYYEIIGSIRATTAGTFSYVFMAHAKNGTNYTETNGGVYLGTYSVPNLTSLVYLNGSTDYVEMYAYLSSSGTRYVEGNSVQTKFSGAMVRAA